MGNFEEPSAARMIRYGFGGAAINVFYILYANYLIFFWTEYAGVSAVLAGSIYFVGRFAMAICDPIAGIVVDNTYTRWGKRIPYLVFLTPILMVLFVLMFFSSGVEKGNSASFYFVIFMMFCILSSFQTIAVQSLAPAMAQNLGRRNFVVMSNQVMGTVFSILALVIAVPLANRWGVDGTGWTYVAIFFSVVICLFIALCISAAKKYDVESTRQVTHFKLKEAFHIITGTKAILILILTFGLIISANEMISITNMYLFRYAIGNENLYSLVMMFTLPVSLIAAFQVPFLAKKIGKKKVFLGACMLGFVKPIGLLVFTPFTNIFIIILLFVIHQFAMTTMVCSVWMMVTDCIEYVLLTKKIQCAALVTSCNTFMLDLGGGGAGFLVGAILKLIGYKSNSPMNEAVLSKIIFLNSGIPGILLMVALIIFFWYPINNRILKELGANIGNQVEK